MMIPTGSRRFADYIRRLQVRWAVVALFAIVITYIDGFWLTALQGAIGAIERNEPPFVRWLRDSTLILPLVFVAVVVALLIVHRWFGQSRRELVKLGATTLLIAVLSGGVGISAVVASSVRDYQLQKQHLELMHSHGVAAQPGAVEVNGFGSAPPLAYTLYCNLRGVAADNTLTLMQYATLMVHVRAISFASVLLLITNLVLVGGLLALCSNRLWAVRMVESAPAIEVGTLVSAG